jgi:hypothetical protein
MVTRRSLLDGTFHFISRPFSSVMSTVQALVLNFLALVLLLLMGIFKHAAVQQR